MLSSIKKKIPKPIKRTLRAVLNKTIIFWITIKRKTRKFLRQILKTETKPGYCFAILCIKKPVYADMAIENINSLHYLNPGHTIVLYCDTLCYDYLQKRKYKFDYPHKVIIQDNYGITTKPWQNYKIDVHIKAAWNDQIETDADGIWHHDPVIDKNRITTLVINQKMKDQEKETLIIKNIFKKNEWLEFNHYVSAFVSIPKKYMTEKVAQDLRYFNETIFNHPLEFIKDKTEREGMRRLSEELAINFTLQTNFPSEKITTLKTEDDPGVKQSLQSLYYGCVNQVTK